jgi:hypothetical protein
MSNINTTYVSDTPTGDVWLDDFDTAVFENLKGFISNDKFYVNIDGVPPPPYNHERESEYRRIGEPGDVMPGIPMTFAAADERFVSFVYPTFVIRRESVEPALTRWPSRSLKYRAPAPGANPVTVQWGPNLTLEGWDKYEHQQSAYPFDIMYMISIMTTDEKAEQHAQLMLKHIMRRFPPRDAAGLIVPDSIGDDRLYEVIADSGPVSLKEALDLVDEQSGYSYTIQVQAELDLRDPYVQQVATSLDFNWHSGVD